MYLPSGKHVICVAGGLEEVPDGLIESLGAACIDHSLIGRLGESQALEHSKVNTA